MVKKTKVVAKRESILGSLSSIQKGGSMGFTLKDSGKREKFKTGAVRDNQEGKGRFDLLPCHAIRRVAKIFEGGARKYESRNWEKGINLCRFLESALRHTFQALNNETDEDHLAQASWNLLCAIETKKWIDDGILPKELDDIPKRQKKLGK